MRNKEYYDVFAGRARACFDGRYPAADWIAADFRKSWPEDRTAETVTAALCYWHCRNANLRRALSGKSS